MRICGALICPQCEVGIAQVKVAPQFQQRDWRDGRIGAEGKWVIFVTDGTAMPKRDLMKMATEQPRKGPFKTNVDIWSFGDAGAIQNKVLEVSSGLLGTG